MAGAMVPAGVVAATPASAHGLTDAQLNISLAVFFGTPLLLVAALVLGILLARRGFRLGPWVFVLGTLWSIVPIAALAWTDGKLPWLAFLVGAFAITAAMLFVGAFVWRDGRRALGSWTVVIASAWCLWFWVVVVSAADIREDHILQPSTPKASTNTLGDARLRDLDRMAA